MKKILFVFGTRPEAIKLCPLIIEMKKNSCFDTRVCVTGQHREMLNQVLSVFNIMPDFDLDIMRDNQTLSNITSDILNTLSSILKKENPDFVLVHGDTSSTFATSLSCFYAQIPIGHIEAGLRTHDISMPFPEEFNRQAVGLIAQLHFAPTEQARLNLIRDGKNPNKIFVTGNTAIDALQMTVIEDYSHSCLDWVGSNRLILVTAHRRENFGEPMRNMFMAIKKIVNEFEDVKVIYPVHLNPQVNYTAKEVLSDNDKILLVSPLDVVAFHNILMRCYFVLTDSGGIQEEAPSLGKPVLVMRNTTERPEGVVAGTLKLVGTGTDTIYESCKTLLENEDEYQKMSRAINPYGDGTASKQIVEILRKRLS